jgi:ureidoacrylate peracid hydrolase
MKNESIISPSGTALLIVDVQNDYCHPEGCLAKQGMDVSQTHIMIPVLDKFIQEARKFKLPIIFIQTIHEPSTDSKTWMKRLKYANEEGLCRKGTWGCEFFKVSPADQDIVVIKHRYSAFINTRLDSILRSLSISTLLMAGVSTNVCVESTARDGFMLDYDIVFLSDCTAAFSEEAHDMTLKNIDEYFGTVMRSNEIIDDWYTEEASKSV